MCRINVITVVLSLIIVGNCQKEYSCPPLNQEICKATRDYEENFVEKCNVDLDCKYGQLCCNDCNFQHKICWGNPVFISKDESLKNKFCPKVRPCFSPLKYDVRYRCGSDESCPYGHKCCRGDCYVHKVCVTASDKEGHIAFAPTTESDMQSLEDAMTTTTPMIQRESTNAEMTTVTATFSPSYIVEYVSHVQNERVTIFNGPIEGDDENNKSLGDNTLHFNEGEYSGGGTIKVYDADDEDKFELTSENWIPASFTTAATTIEESSGNGPIIIDTDDEDFVNGGSGDGERILPKKTDYDTITEGSGGDGDEYVTSGHTNESSGNGLIIIDTDDEDLVNSGSGEGESILPKKIDHDISTEGSRGDDGSELTTRNWRFDFTTEAIRESSGNGPIIIDTDDEDFVNGGSGDGDGILPKKADYDITIQGSGGDGDEYIKLGLKNLHVSESSGNEPIIIDTDDEDLVSSGDGEGILPKKADHDISTVVQRGDDDRSELTSKNWRFDFTTEAIGQSSGNGPILIDTDDEDFVNGGSGDGEGILPKKTGHDISTEGSRGDDELTSRNWRFDFTTEAIGQSSGNGPIIIDTDDEDLFNSGSGDGKSLLPKTTYDKELVITNENTIGLIPSTAATVYRKITKYPSQAGYGKGDDDGTGDISEFSSSGDYEPTELLSTPTPVLPTSTLLIYGFEDGDDEDNNVESSGEDLDSYGDGTDELTIQNDFLENRSNTTSHQETVKTGSYLNTTRSDTHYDDDDGTEIASGAGRPLEFEDEDGSGNFDDEYMKYKRISNLK